MVCNEIILGGNSILKIYHKDFNDASDRKILHDRKIRRCNLESHQYQVAILNLQRFPQNTAHFIHIKI